MTKVVLLITPRAREDLSAIWDYTSERWGPQQAETYLDDIRAAFAALLANPHVGAPCDWIRAGYRKLPVGSHVIYYRLTAAGPNISRILHARMDVARHLPDG